MRFADLIRSTPHPGRHVLRLLAVALGVAAFTAPAHAFIDDVELTINPGEPTAAQEISIRVTGISTPTAEVTDVTVDGQTVTIKIDDTCRVFCPADTFDFEVLVGPLNAGSYDIEITNVFDTPVATMPLEVSFPPLGGLQALTHFEPIDPNDNEVLRVLVTAVTCEGMKLVSTFVDGDRVEIRGVLEDAPCPASSGITSAFSAAVGPLEAGTYQVVVLLQDTADPGAGYQEVSSRQVQIGDAPDTVELIDGRFRVEVTWRDHNDGTGAGRPVPGASESTTLFSFFGRDNWELMVKVLDGCALNDHFWVFTAASTDVEYTLKVTDTSTGEMRTYTNQLGDRAPAITDVEAFASCSS